MPKVNIPRVGVINFPDTMSQEQILQAIETDIIPNYQRPEYGVMESGIRGIKRGLTRAGSLVGDVIPALGASALGFDDYAKRQLEEAAATERQIQEENAPGFTSFKQIEGPMDFLRYGAETLGETLPDIAGIVGTGGVGGALGKRAAVKGAEELAERIGQREARSKVLPGGVSAERLGELESTALRRAAPVIAEQKAAGQAVGIYLGSYAVNTPDVFQSIYEQTGELAPGASLLFGGAVAALDAVLPKQLLGSLSQTEKLTIAEKVLEKSGMQPGLLRKATALIPATAAKEGLTEGAQEFITAAAEKFVDNNQDLWSSDNFNRYLESAVRGAVAGAPFGGVQAVGERLGERSRAGRKEYEEFQRQQEEAQPREPQQLSLFQPGEITPPSPGLTFPSPKVEEKEPETARTKYKESKKMRKAQLGLRPEPYEVVPSAVEGQMELFDAKGKATVGADVRRIEEQVKAEQKKKIAEGKAQDQALKEAIAELAPKDINLIDYARRTGITSTPLFQLVQQATELPQPKVGKAPKQKAEKPTAEPAPAAPATLLTAEKLKGVGLSPLSGFYRRLVGKDVLTDEDTVRAEIEKAKLNPNISASTIKGLEALETELPLQLTQPEVPKEVKEEPVTETPETLDVTPEGQGQLFSRVGRDFRGMPKEELEANAPVLAEQLNNELKTGVADKAEVLDKVRGLFDALDDADLLTQDERRAFYEIDKTLPITQTQKPGAQRGNDMMYLDLINMLNLEREKTDAVGLGRPRVREDIKEELEQYQEPETAAEAAFAEEGVQEVVEDPKDVWDKTTAGMGVPYDSLNADGKDMWAGAVEGGYANLRVANELFTNFGTAEAPTAEKPAVEEPADIGEQEAAEFETPSTAVVPAGQLTSEEKKQLDRFERRFGDLELNPETNKNQVRNFAKQLLAAGAIDENAYSEIDTILKDKDMVAEDALSELRSYVMDMPETFAENKRKKAALEKAPIEGQVTVVNETVGREVAKLGKSDVQTLEQHYGAKAGTKKFLEKVKEDVVKFANEGADAVAEAIRGIIKAIHQGVLAVALIFNPTYVTHPAEAVVISKADTTYTQQVKAQVPAQAAVKMSSGAKEVYETLYPGIKDRLMQENKLLVITDKPNARVFIFNPDGSLLLEKKVLVGRTVGDYWKGNTEVVSNRITPAGLFTMGLRDATRSVGEAKTAGQYDFKKVFVLDKAIEGEYSVTLFHSVWLHESDATMRAKALQSESAADSRYSFGCINVDKATYKYLIDNHLQQMDGAALFIVPDNQNLTKDFLTGAIAQNKQKVDDLTRTEFKPATETITVPGVKEEVKETKVEREQFAMREEKPKQQKAPAATRRRRPEPKPKKPVAQLGAPTETKKPEKQNPKQQRKTLGEQANSVINAPYRDLPPATQPIVNGALNALSNLPTSLRSAALGFLTLDQIFEIYGKIMPSIKKLINALEIRASDVAQRREFLEKNIKKYHEVFKKYTPAQNKKFFQTFFDTTVEQIEPLVVSVKETIDSNGQTRRVRTYSLTKNPATAANPITQAFYAMPKDVQEVYVDMRREYDNYADELENLITKDVTPGTAKKLRTQFELRRLKVYLPLFRQGNYWLSYTDSAGENVVMAFESERERQLEKQRATSQKAKDVKEFARFEDIISRTGAPPVGFVGKVLKTLKDEKVPKAVLDQVYSSYLSLFPAESVRQMYRKRKGIAGYETDAVEVFANVGSRMVNQIGNLKHAEAIDTAMNEIIAQGEKDGSMAAREVAQNIAAQTDYMMNPVPNKISAGLSTFSYYSYIAGNVSSALINLTQLPIVVYSLLGGEYGFNDAYEAMKKATSMYLNGAKDDNATFLPDWTFGKGKNLRPDLKSLYEEAVKRSVIRRSTSHEIVDMRRQKAGDYVGMRAKVETGLAWVFQNSERANREITLIAAYELARKKGLSQQAAIEKAMDTVKAAHGTALSETGPRLFQSNVGRVVFTFKRFAQSQIYLIQKLFRQAFGDADPEVRAVARKQLMGIYGMAFMFAGAQGVPLYGAASMLAGFLMGDDDEPIDVDEYIRASVGDMVYKGPVNQLLNIDIASRTGFNNMVWRDNPKRLAEVGPLTYTLEQLAGPSYSAAMSVQKGFKDISEGNGYRGLEAMMPGFIRNGMKGLRFAVEGATNRDGVPIVQDVNAYNIAMQITGFTPADLSEAYARAGAKKEVEKKILERRGSLLDKLYTARREGDADGVQEIRESIRDFNSKNPEKNVRITSDTIQRSFRGHQQREKEMVDGVRINPALRRRLEEEYGAD